MPVKKRSGMKFVAEVGEGSKLLEYKDRVFVIQPDCPVCEVVNSVLEEVIPVPPGLRAHTVFLNALVSIEYAPVYVVRGTKFQ